MSDFPDPIQALRADLPAIFARRAVRELTGGIVAPQTVANSQARGEGPPAHRINGRSALERESFCDWLAGRSGRGRKKASGGQG